MKTVIITLALMSSLVDGQNCPTGDANTKACAKCDLNKPVHITDVTMTHPSPLFPIIHQSFGLQTIPGWTSDCCMKKSYLCVPNGNWTWATIVFNQEIVPDMTEGTNFDSSDCYDNPKKTCAIELTCNNRSQWAYTSSIHHVVLTNLSTIICSNYLAPAISKLPQ